MSRIPLADPAEMTAEQRQQYNRFPSNLTRMLLLADGRLARSLPETANALRASELDAGIREAAILRVAALTGSAYERMQHLEQARKVGWNDAQIATIEAGSRATLPENLAAVLAFVDECVATTHVDDEVFGAARQVLSDRDLVTVLLLVGHYTTIALLTETLEVELDAEADPFASEH